jgi:superfamily II DNA or RNA helicase
MSKKARDDAMDGFRTGRIDWLTNVHVLTEGVDVPNAEVCMLARSPQHSGTYLQMVGRVLRSADGKTEALLIDLPG